MRPSTWYGFRLALRKAQRTSLSAGSEEGASLVEFALVLPTLSMVLVGIIYGGITFYNYVQLTNAVAIGARTLATNRAALAGPPTACTLATNSVKTASYNLNSAYLTIPTPTFTSTGGSTCSALAQYDAGTVYGIYTCSLTIPIAGTNLCPYAKGATIIPASVTGTTAVTCPYASCIVSTATVYIQ